MSRAARLVRSMALTALLASWATGSIVAAHGGPSHAPVPATPAGSGIRSPFAGLQAAPPAVSPTPIASISSLRDFQPPKGTLHPKLESALSQMVTTGTDAPSAWLSLWGTPPRQLSRVSLVIETDDNGTDDVVASVRALGLPVQSVYQGLVQVAAPPSSFVSLAALPHVRFVRRPIDLFPQAVTSEDVQISGALEWQQRGFIGQGVRIAVVDQGFQGYKQLLGRELPANVRTRSFVADTPDVDSVSEHGAAVAEIIADMAPGATLYLVTISTEVELGNAVKWLQEEKVQIVSFSLGALAAPTDGSGTLDGIVDAARRSGILWVAAAGNYGSSHWQGDFVDTDGDGWHEFAPGQPLLPLTMGINEVGLFLATWNGWPRTAQDFGFYLFWQGPNNNLDLIGFSDSEQTGMQPPFEAILSMFGPRGRYFLGIKRQAGKMPVHFHVYSLAHPLLTPVPEGSVVSPASARGALAVGATNGFDQIQRYSSRGPTGDGRIKPDLVAPDSVSTVTYGESAFPGTSASTPHVAGAAALVLSAYPYLSADDLERYLEERAQHILTMDKNNIYGAGRLRLSAVPDVSPPPTSTPEAATPTPAAPTPGGTVTPSATATPRSTGTPRPSPTVTPRPPEATPTGVVWPSYFNFIPRISSPAE